MDQSLVHTFSWENSYGPMVLKVRQKFPQDWYWSMDGSSQIQNSILGIRNSILGMASRDLSNTKTIILGATPGVIPGIDGNPHERLSFAPAFSERFFENWDGPRARAFLVFGHLLATFLSILVTFLPIPVGSPPLRHSETNFKISSIQPRMNLGCRKWGCNKWGLKGCLAALPGNRPKSALFRPFSAFFALFRRVRRAPGKSRKRRKKAFFLRYPRISLNPHLLNPHLLAALQ